MSLCPWLRRQKMVAPQCSLQPFKPPLTSQNDHPKKHMRVALLYTHLYMYACIYIYNYIYISVYVECVCICMSFLETRRIFVNKQFLICFSNDSSRATRSFTEFCLRVRGAWPKRRSGHVGFSGFMGHDVGLTLWLCQKSY